MIRSQVFDISLKFSVREEERKESNASSENAQNPVSVAMEESDSCHLHESPLIFQREVGGDPITASHISKTFSLPHINPRSKSLYIISKKVIIKKKKEKKNLLFYPQGYTCFPVNTYCASPSKGLYLWVNTPPYKTLSISAANTSLQRSC